MKLQTVVLSVCCVALWGVFPSEHLAAQELPATEEAAVLEPTPAEVVPVAEVAARSDDLRQALRAAADRLSPDPAVVEIEEQLPELRRTLSSEREETSQALGASQTLDQLADLERTWSGRARDLSIRRKELTKRAAAVESEIAALEAANQLWQRTLEGARASRSPQAVLESIRLNLNAIEAVREQASRRRSELLSLLNTVAQEELAASETSSNVSGARAALRGRLLEPDSATLWEALTTGAALSTIPGRVRETVAADVADVIRFLEEHRRGLPSLALAFFASLIGAVLVRNRIRRLGETEALRGSAEVFEKPVSIAVLFTFFAGIFALPFAPAIATDVVGALILVPVFRVVAPLVHHSFRPLLFAIAGFYLFDRARDVVDAVVSLERFLLLAQTVVGVGLIVWLLRPSRLALVPPEAKPQPVLGRLLQISGVVLVASALANVLGYTTFSRILGEGIFSSVYLGVLFFSAYRVGLTVLLVILGSRWIRQLAIVTAHREVILRGGRLILLLGAAIFWARNALQAFGVRQVVEGVLVGVLTTSLSIGTVSVSLGDVLGFSFTIVAALFLSRAIRTVLEDDVFPTMRLPQGVGSAISTTAQYVVLLGGFLLAVGAAGIDMSRFTLLAGALGVGIGFGLQNVVNNFASGLILLYERPVRVGDVVEFAGLLAVVTRIGIRSSTVRTFSGAEVIVPNANLISEQLTNWTLSDPQRRIEVPVGVAYGSDHEKVLEVLLEATMTSAHVLDDPEPTVLFKGFGDSSLNFEVRFWTTSEVFLQAESAVIGSIYAALAREGIQIPFPQRDLHLRSVDGEAGRRLGSGSRGAEPSGNGD